MSGLEDPRTIDLISETADGTVQLIMIETREWGASPDQLDQFQVKLNNYCGYILQGNLVLRNPELKDKPVEIVLRTISPPPREIEYIFASVTDQLEDLGLGFRIWPGLQPPE